jgi:hypothetical protein
MKQYKPLVIHAKVIMQITGKSKSYAYNLLKKIKAVHNKDPHHLVTIEEYANFHGIPVEKVKEYH